VWRLGADIDTDALAPGHAMKHGIDIIAKHCLEAIRPEFASEVRPGDVIVAGPNFGIGSSREQAAAVLVQLGVAAVIAPSYSGLYFRNAFNVGLLLLTCAEAESLVDGDRIELDTRTPARAQPPTRARWPASPCPDSSWTWSMRVGCCVCCASAWPRRKDAR
jgi:3-isopropylmalate/(R)-2-methylmalate dehydratase small subunit